MAQRKNVMTITMPPHMRKKLQELAKKEHRSESNMIHMLIDRQYMNTKNPDEQRMISAIEAYDKRVKYFQKESQEIAQQLEKTIIAKKTMEAKLKKQNKT